MVETPDISNIGMSPFPTPKKQEKAVLNFYDALREIVSDPKKKMSRVDWQDLNSYGFLRGEVLHIRTEKNESYGDHQWLLQKADIESDDWIIFE
jgi:hypothetical protein